MSDTQSTAETANQGAAPQPKSNTRTYVLLAILGLAVAALLYDYQVARPAVEGAHKMINDLADERSGSAEGQLTNTEVAELFAMSPAEEKKGPHYLLERYSWMGGLPWRSYDCWIVYTPANDGEEVTYRFNSAYLNEEPEAQFQPDFVPEDPEVDTELPGDPSGDDSPPGGGGGPPGGGGRPPGGGGRPPSDDEPNADVPDEGDAPEGDKPEGDKPEGDKPEGDKPEGDKPEGDKPEGDKPEGDKPEGDKPEGDKPEGDKPAEEPKKTEEDK